MTLGNFLDYYHLDPRAIYSKKICFSRLCVRAGAASDFAEPLEETMTKAFARFAVIDSRRWIRFLLGLLPKSDNTDFAALSPVEKRMLQMFYVTLWGKTAESWRMKKFSITCMLSQTVPFCWGSCRHFCSINMTALILSTNLWM